MVQIWERYGWSELTRAGDEEGLSTDNDDLLAEKKLLGHNRGESTQKVTLAVNNDSIRHDEKYRKVRMNRLNAPMSKSIGRCIVYLSVVMSRQVPKTFI